MNRFLEIDEKKYERIICISDIHGGYDTFQKLLSKIDFSDEDLLVLLGDNVQRGNNSHKVMEYIEVLNKKDNVLLIQGNHESYILYLLREENGAKLMKHLRKIWYPCILKYWTSEIGVNVKEDFDPVWLQKEIKKRYGKYIDLMKSMYYGAESENYIFVHAGIDVDKPWKESDIDSLMISKEFQYKKHNEEKKIVVGHWPTSNYRKNSLKCDILVDEKNRIISIDGGFGIKTFGQLNAFIIDPKEGTWYSESEDNLKKTNVKQSNTIKFEKIVKVDWNDNKVKILNRGVEFTYCQKLSTGEKFYVKNELILKKRDLLMLKDDYISRYHLVKKGEYVKEIKRIGKFAIAKYRGEVGLVPVKCLED